MDSPNEGQGFDPTKFVEELKQLSVEDQRVIDARYIWKKDDEEELSASPGASPKCIARVAEALKNHPDKTNEIRTAVDEFLAKSTGADAIRVRDVIKRPDDLLILWRSSEQRGDFWQRVTSAALQKPENSVSGEIEEAGKDAAAAVKAIL